MVSDSSEKTYQYYLNCYKRWCDRHQLDELASLNKYKAYLQSIKRSEAYIRNSINIISKRKNIPLKLEFSSHKSIQKFNAEELKVLKQISEKNYESEELSLILLLLLETHLKIKDILKLTKLDVYNILSTKQTTLNKPIPHSALYIFEYLLSTALQKNAHDLFFTKTYHGYLYAFKTRQKNLFPNKPYRTFHEIRHTVNY